MNALCPYTMFLVEWRTTCLYNVQARMNALRLYTMFWVQLMHYVPIASSEWNECTTSLYNVYSRMNALRTYKLYTVEWMHYVPIPCIG